MKKKLHFTCAFCDSEKVVLSKDKKIEFEVPNPGKVEVVSDCYECKECKEIFFDEQQSDNVAQQIDKALVK